MHRITYFWFLCFSTTVNVTSTKVKPFFSGFGLRLLTAVLPCWLSTDKSLTLHLHLRSCRTWQSNIHRITFEWVRCKLWDLRSPDETTSRQLFHRNGNLNWTRCAHATAKRSKVGTHDPLFLLFLPARLLPFIIAAWLQERTKERTKGRKHLH